MRYMDNTFNDIHLSTIGIDYKFKYLTLDNGQPLKIQIWDTAGQERYRSITKSYLKGANGIIIVYDVSNHKSFEGAQNWIKQIKDKVSPRVCVALAANKIDLEEREVSTDEGENFSKENNFPYYETSAKEGIGINECFDNMIKQIYQNYGNSPLNENININDDEKNESKKGCC